MLKSWRLPWSVCFTTGTNIHYFHLTAIYPGELGSAGSASGPPPCVPEVSVWKLATRVYYEPMSFLSCQSTEGNTKQHDVAWPHFIFFDKVRPLQISK